MYKATEIERTGQPMPSGAHGHGLDTTTKEAALGSKAVAPDVVAKEEKSSPDAVVRVEGPEPWAFDASRTVKWSGQVVLPTSLTKLDADVTIECTGSLCPAPDAVLSVEWPNRIVAAETKPSSELAELDLARALAVAQIKGKSPTDKREIQSRNALHEQMLECRLGQDGQRLLLIGTEAAKDYCTQLVKGLELSTRWLVALELPS